MQVESALCEIALDKGLAFLRQVIIARQFGLSGQLDAFNVANNSVLSIMAIMQKTNDQTKKGILWDLNGNGSFSSAEQVLRTLANDLFTDINETGDSC